MTANLQTQHELRRGLGEGFYVVPQPDHPMLLSGPDILVGGEGKITAVFLIRKHFSEKQLLARIMATRLAMPSSTRIFAQMAEDVDIPSNILRNFDESALEQGIPRQLLRYCVSDAAPRVDRDALAENKRRHSEKFAFAFLLTSLRKMHKLNTVPPEMVIRELSDLDVGTFSYAKWTSRLRGPSAQVRGSCITSLTSQRNSVQQLRTLCDSGLIHSYQLDAGVPYENPNANLNVLLVEHWPVMRHDPEKPLRSAAFGCWIMAESSSADDISLLIERSRDPKYMRRWRHA